MVENYHIAASRAFYVYLRNQVKCPPMIAVKTTWGWFVEAKDESVSLDQVKASDSWDAKTAGVQEWIRQKETRRKKKGE